MGVLVEIWYVIKHTIAGYLVSIPHPEGYTKLLNEVEKLYIQIWTETVHSPLANNLSYCVLLHVYVGAKSVKAYFPEGKWYDFHTFKTVSEKGEETIELKTPLDHIQVLHNY